MAGKMKGKAKGGKSKAGRKCPSGCGGKLDAKGKCSKCGKQY